MRVTILSALLAAAALAPAAPPEVKLTAAKSDIPGLYVVTIDAPGAKSLKTRIKGVYKQVAGPNDRTLYIAPAGPVTVSAVAASDTGELSDIQDVVLDAVPPPLPGPPTPPEPPKPTTPVAFLAVVEETSDGTANRGAFFSNPDLSARMKANSLRWRVVDKDVVGADGKPPADVARLLPLAAGKPYPSLFLIDATGRILDQRPMPKTPADLLTLLAQFGG